MCALLSPCLFQLGWEEPVLVPGEGMGWGWRQFLPVHLQIAVVMGREFLREIQHTAYSLSPCSSLTLSIAQVTAAPLGAQPWCCWAALPCPQASPRLLWMPGTSQTARQHTSARALWSAALTLLLVSALGTRWFVAIPSVNGVQKSSM